jgi:hypothetical protein
MTNTRFSKATRTSLAALAIALSGTFFTAVAAGAQTIPAGAPRPMVCTPPAGTIMSAKAVSSRSAWLPTNVSSAFLTGPGNIGLNKTQTSEASQQISASFTLDEGLLFVSAHEQYGLSLERSHSQSQTWTYQKHVPKGQTLRLEQYHQGYEIGIKERRMGYKGLGCHVYTLTSLTGNFFPSASTSGAAYCYGLTPDKRSRVQVGFKCHDIH